MVRVQVLAPIRGSAEVARAGAMRAATLRIRTTRAVVIGDRNTIVVRYRVRIQHAEVCRKDVEAVVRATVKWRQSRDRSKPVDRAELARFRRILRGRLEDRRGSVRTPVRRVDQWTPAPEAITTERCSGVVISSRSRIRSREELAVQRGVIGLRGLVRRDARLVEQLFEVAQASHPGRRFIDAVGSAVRRSDAEQPLQATSYPGDIRVTRGSGAAVSGAAMTAVGHHNVVRFRVEATEVGTVTAPELAAPPMRPQLSAKDCADLVARLEAASGAVMRNVPVRAREAVDRAAERGGPASDVAKRANRRRLPRLVSELGSRVATETAPVAERTGLPVPGLLAARVDRTPDRYDRETRKGIESLDALLADLGWDLERTGREEIDRCVADRTARSDVDRS